MILYICQGEGKDLSDGVLGSNQRMSLKQFKKFQKTFEKPLDKLKKV